ncbi:TPM domain-containing protein [Methylocystis sp. H62]|uniref:TPM domain-containing protein n=1 Tax=Methylocystis sp. H62 TaxID=2785789 RepID=UPI0018C1D721|nr:TPM domain-containing protein [Methylocystis sp. H62]MBG0795153.1 TPM domain-containing protein [Methylocystis sp. H62]
MRGAARWLAPLFFLVASLAFAAVNYPPLTGRVVDQADVIPPSTKSAIESKLRDLEDKSGIQLVVASVASLEGLDVETYANGLFRAWKLGETKKNNGVLFLVAPNERKMRIEVGYGLEGTLTDALSKIILTSAVAPRFKARDYGAGIERGVEGIIEVLSGDSAEWTKRARGPQSTTFDELSPLIFFALFLFIVVWMARSARGRQRYQRSYRRGGPPIIVLPPSGGFWGGDSWGGGGGGSSDGGGFSGGGGSSGGGGASGDW